MRHKVLLSVLEWDSFDICGDFEPRAWLSSCIVNNKAILFGGAVYRRRTHFCCNKDLIMFEPVLCRKQNIPPTRRRRERGNPQSESYCQSGWYTYVHCWWRISWHGSFSCVSWHCLRFRSRYDALEWTCHSRCASRISRMSFCHDSQWQNSCFWWSHVWWKLSLLQWHESLWLRFFQMAIFCCLVAKEKKTDAIITMSFDFVFVRRGQHYDTHYFSQHTERWTRDLFSIVWESHRTMETNWNARTSTRWSGRTLGNSSKQ